MRTRCVVLAVVALVGCGDDSSSSSDEGVVIRFALPDSGRPQPLTVPFPSDVYKDSDGTLADDINDWTLAAIDDPQPSALIAQMGAYDGFGVQSGVFFAVGGLADGESIDPASLLPEDVFFIDVETGQKLACSVGWDDFARVITVLPNDVLKTGAQYAVGLTRGAKVVDGVEVGASSSFTKLRDNGASGEAGALYSAAIDMVVAAGAPEDELIAATSYTTATAHTPLLATVERLYAGAYGASPTLNTSPALPYRATRFGRTTHAGWTATLDQWLGTPLLDSLLKEVPGFAGDPGGREPAGKGIAHDQIGAVISGSIVAPEFLRAFTKTAAYDDGTIEYNASGEAIPARLTAEIPVTIVLPKSTPPANGFPVVIVQHGLGGDRFLALAIGNELARAGYATVAIDGFFHGLRDEDNNDTANNAPGTFTGPDGFADSSSAFVILNIVGDLKNALRMRDSFWQFAFDLVSVRRMIDTPNVLAFAADEFGGVTPKLDASKVAVLGWSLGGIMTTTFAAATPTEKVNPVVLTSPASNLGILFGESPIYAEQAVLLAGAARLRTTSFEAGPFSVALQLIENVAVAGDTGAFAPLAAAKHDLWVIAAEQDESVPYHSIDQLVRSFGATQVTPVSRSAIGVPQAASPYSPGGRVAAFFEVAPGNHGHTFDRYATLSYEPPYPRSEGERFVLLPEPLVIRQTVVREQRAIAAFIQSVFAGTPTVDITSFPGLRPVHDLDDDGACDAAETSGGSDPADPGSRPSGTGGCERDLGFGTSAN